MSRAYVNPYIQIQTTEEDKSVCNHQTDTQPVVLCGLMSDLVICKCQTTSTAASRHSKSRLFDLNRRIKSELESFFAALLQYAFC